MACDPHRRPLEGLRGDDSITTDHVNTWSTYFNKRVKEEGFGPFVLFEGCCWSSPDDLLPSCTIIMHHNLPRGNTLPKSSNSTYVWHLPVGLFMCHINNEANRGNRGNVPFMGNMFFPLSSISSCRSPDKKRPIARRRWRAVKLFIFTSGKAH